ncbi:MAG: site-specific integrase [Clostridia bacterium]|nr:site-specific integrase [Clostridia bacterium]
MPNTRVNNIENIFIYNDFNDLVDDFISYKRSFCLTDRTINDYRYYITRFFKYSNGKLDLLSLKDSSLKYFSTLKGISNAYYNNIYKNINALFNWCVDENILESNPLKLAKLKKKQEQSKARYINPNGIKRLLDSMNLKTFKGLRDYTIILITLDTGVRPKELFNITIDDFNSISNEIIIKESVSKTRCQRILPLTNHIVDLVNKLIKVRSKYWTIKYIFCTADGNYMDSNRWSHIMKKYSDNINIKIKPYDLRHTFAIMFLRNGGNIFALQRIMRAYGLKYDKKVFSYITD